MSLEDSKPMRMEELEDDNEDKKSLSSMMEIGDRSSVSSQTPSLRSNYHYTDRVDTHASGSGNNVAMLLNYMAATESAKARIRDGRGAGRVEFVAAPNSGIRTGYGGYVRNLRSPSFRSVAESHLGLEQQSNYSSCYTESHGSEISN
ncbi:hypothetical protein F3Y22_tig00113548pilonHSYRG00106 [Hibiscus syriacus]|uniref:DUF4005 domain-containing protein n=1 Tax=Hibiscus syriacus TaxID=106335 RepID=A0A6A2WNW9_HIBSY|nr:hypothetical protein F3Y22_tig00113548pilonHSYRG00106 [Hibiscus syriacus]